MKDEVKELKEEELEQVSGGAVRTLHPENITANWQDNENIGASGPLDGAILIIGNVQGNSGNSKSDIDVRKDLY